MGNPQCTLILQSLKLTSCFLEAFSLIEESVIVMPANVEMVYLHLKKGYKVLTWNSICAIEGTGTLNDVIAIATGTEPQLSLSSVSGNRIVTGTIMTGSGKRTGCTEKMRDILFPDQVNSKCIYWFTKIVIHLAGMFVNLTLTDGGYMFGGR